MSNTAEYADVFKNYFEDLLDAFEEVEEATEVLNMHNPDRGEKTHILEEIPWILSFKIGHSEIACPASQVRKIISLDDYTDKAIWEILKNGIYEKNGIEIQIVDIEPEQTIDIWDNPKFQKALPKFLIWVSFGHYAIACNSVMGVKSTEDYDLLLKKICSNDKGLCAVDVKNLCLVLDLKQYLKANFDIKC